MISIRIRRCSRLETVVPAIVSSYKIYYVYQYVLVYTVTYVTLAPCTVSISCSLTTYKHLLSFANYRYTGLIGTEIAKSIPHLLVQLCLVLCL